MSTFESTECAAAERGLADFSARRRGQWRWYVAVLVACLVVLGGVLFRIGQNSEVRAVRSNTSQVAPLTLPPGPLADTLSRVWESSDRTASGEVFSKDIVVTYSEHTVSGRDARTGVPRWSYTRANRSVCTVDLQEAVAIAVYAEDGICDEVTGLKADSGERLFVRTLTLNAAPQTLQVVGIPGSVAIIAPDGIELITPNDPVLPGIDYWLDSQPTGCRTISVVLGTEGLSLPVVVGVAATPSVCTN
jgi:hypothetical protein